MGSVRGKGAGGKRVVLVHTTPHARLASILRSGLLPALSKGRLAGGWLTTPGKRSWAEAHVKQRHQAERVVAIEVAPWRAGGAARRQVELLAVVGLQARAVRQPAG